MGEAHFVKRFLPVIVRKQPADGITQLFWDGTGSLYGQLSCRGGVHGVDGANHSGKRAQKQLLFFAIRRKYCLDEAMAGGAPVLGEW